MTQPDPQATATTRNRYQRLAPFYDTMEIMFEWRYKAWRQRLWSLAAGPNVLEVGVGTGKNIGFYPAGIRVTAIDLTPAMLTRAGKKAARLGAEVALLAGDVQQLDFPDNSFDAAVATFVFCSVPDPPLGLRELQRVVRPGGQVLLLEHVRSENALLGALMDAFNPLAARLYGANINRQTVEAVGQAGLAIETVDSMLHIYRLIVAHNHK